ncbi:hypothetical protein [uncultured Alsobacter sp.]|uniref:hypothetical protein n=1 Tax=uncultured Alsobacter sp. TaxID=1748258 RepID=UPI0025E3ED63|nr:hypothetical protein [uncultured Alsobacter sp.]
MTEISAEMVEAAALRKELMRLMREDFDPTPPGWEGREWDDNAEDVADKMLVVVSSTTSLAMSAVRAAKMLIDNINEFGQVTDPVFLDCAETSIKAALAVRESPRVRHLKRGSVYEVIGEAVAQVSTGRQVPQFDAEGYAITVRVRNVQDGDRLTDRGFDHLHEGFREKARAKIRARDGVTSDTVPVPRELLERLVDSGVLMGAKEETVERQPLDELRALLGKVAP